MSDTQKEQLKKKQRLKDITFEHNGAHIALVGPMVGGPANEVQTILWKSKGTSHITKEDVERALGTGATPESIALEKAKFNSEVRDSIREVLEEQYAGKYEWLYLEDFSDSEIVFSSDGGMFIVGYSLSEDDKYVLEDVAKGVEYKSILVETDSLRLSKDAQEKLSEGSLSLVTKALDNPETNQRVKDAVLKTLEKARNMQEEIQKAVDAAKAEAATQMEAVQVELTKAKEIIAKFETAQKEQLIKSRTEAVAKFDEEGAAALVQATESLDDAAFATILKSLELKAKQVAESDLMTQVSDAGGDATATASKTAELLKARHATN